MKKRKRKKPRKKPHKKSLTLFLVVLLAMLIFIYILNILVGFKQPEIKGFEGFERVSLEVEEGTILLIKDCTALPIIISSEQSYSILMGLTGETDFRPNTHDLIKSILENSSIEILAVKVTDLREGTFYAELVLKKKDQIFSIDSRPSDAIAIGVRAKAPIYVKKDLLSRYGRDICPSSSEPVVEF